MRTYLVISGLLFGAMAVVHVFRLALGWPAQIAGWAVPLELSWIGIVVAGALCAWAFTLVGRGATR